MEAPSLPATTVEDRPPYSTRHRKALVQRIGDLGTTAHGEIFRKIKAHGVGHTPNKNGMFINLSVVSNTLIDEIGAFVDYCIDNDRDLEEYDKRLNECKLSQRFEELPGVTASEATSDVNRNGRDYQETGVDATKERERKQDGVDPIDKTGTPDVENEESKVVVVEHAGDPKTVDESPECLLRLRAIIPVELDKNALNNKRRANTKFLTAKKKYSKKKTTTSDRRTTGTHDMDVMNELNTEPYLV
jgi:hypothetical protein